MISNSTISLTPMPDVSTYVHTGWAIIVLFAVLFNIYVLLKLHKARKDWPFDSAYFTLWRHLAIIDFIGVTHSWITLKHPQALEKNFYNFVLTYPDINMLLMYSFGLFITSVQLSLLTTMAINRVSSLVWPIHHFQVRYCQKFPTFQRWIETFTIKVITVQYAVQLFCHGTLYFYNVIIFRNMQPLDMNQASRVCFPTRSQFHKITVEYCLFWCDDLRTQHQHDSILQHGHYVQTSSKSSNTIDLRYNSRTKSFNQHNLFECDYADVASSVDMVCTFNAL